VIKGSLQNTSFLGKIVQLFAVLFFAIILITTLTTLLTDSDLNNINTVKRMQLIQSLILFVGSPLLLAFLWSDKPLIYLQLKTSNKPSIYLLVILTMMAALPFINLITELNRQISLPDSFAPIENWMKATELQLEQITMKMMAVHSITDLIFNLLLVAVLAGLGEEFFFRGILQKIFGEWRNAILAIWMAAFIFSAIHLQFYGFFPRLLLGAFFGYLLFWSGNLGLPILAHTVNNGLAVLFYYLKFNGVKMPDLDTIGTGDTLYLAAISFVVTVFLIYSTRKKLQNLL